MAVYFSKGIQIKNQFIKKEKPFCILQNGFLKIKDIY